MSEAARLESQRSERRKRVMSGAASFTALFAIWWLATNRFGVPAYIMPTPEAVVASLKLGLVGGTLWAHVAFTVTATLTGLVLGCALGFLLGVVVSESRTLERAIYPVVIAIQSVPKIAVAPLIIVYLGYESASKIFTVVVLCFFPMFVNTITGMRSADRDLVDLFRSYGATRWQIVRDVRLPSTGRFIFAALQIAMVLAIIGCVTSEFIASTRGLGFVIKSRAGELDLSMMFAALILLSLFGMTGVALIRALQRRCMFWEGSS